MDFHSKCKWNQSKCQWNLRNLRLKNFVWSPHANRACSTSSSQSSQGENPFMREMDKDSLLENGCATRCHVATELINWNWRMVCAIFVMLFALDEGPFLSEYSRFWWIWDPFWAHIHVFCGYGTLSGHIFTFSVDMGPLLGTYSRFRWLWAPLWMIIYVSNGYGPLCGWLFTFSLVMGPFVDDYLRFQWV